MKTVSEVTPEKLRGGFYTPQALVDACLDRISDLTAGETLRFLEPSAGDGAFLRGLASGEWRSRVSDVTAIELLEIEAEKSRRVLTGHGLPGAVEARSAIEWATISTDVYDAAVGNPPFVRYQFISASDRAAISALGSRLGTTFRGVGNLWIPVLLAALSRLRERGAFAFVIPTECLTGCSASVVREWVLDHCECLRLDLFAPGSFPGVLQEVVILSGRRGGERQRKPSELVVVDHAEGVRSWSHTLSDAGAWTRYLLDPQHLSALDAAQSLPSVYALGSIAAFEVSIVTGANDFFSVDDSTVDEFGLEDWVVPLLPRARYAPGLTFTAADHSELRTSGASGWLLDFSAERPDPTGVSSAADYLRHGEALGLPARYKCRIRTPWYRVPGIIRGDLLMSKRSHHWPRVIVNEGRAYTTDTIYRGRILDGTLTASDIAASFHNSLTLLTAELEGRSFGGGVLELVPSEIARLGFFASPGIGTALGALDKIARVRDGDRLIAATDEQLVTRKLVPADLLALLGEAREILAERRYGRNRRLSPASIAVAA